MGRLGTGFGLGRRRRVGPLPAVPAAPTPPQGFALNGSGNPALRAMLARVRGGTGRGRIVFKGDSTSAGAGAGGSGGVVAQLTDARRGRPSAALAARLTAAGVPALDNGFVGDGGCTAFGVALPAYDPRVALSGIGPSGGQRFPGGGYLFSDGGDHAEFTLPAADTFEIVAYNVGGACAVAIDGAAPATLIAPGAAVSGNVVTIPNTSNGFTRITAAAATAGTRTVRVATTGTTLLRSIMGYDGRARAVDILNHASCGASSGDQAAAGNGWSNLDALGHDAPDLTIINVGLNDAGAANTPVAAYTANLQALITKAWLSGDVLLVSPNAANPQTFATAERQAALRDAAASVAASNGVAFMDLRAYFGPWSTFAARTADDTVHPDAAAYAEMGEVYRRCIGAMSA